MTTYVTVNDITPKIQYSATAGQTVFTFPFIAFSDTDLKVYVNDVLKTITTDYTVDNDYPDEGGGGSKRLWVILCHNPKS